MRPLPRILSTLWLVTAGILGSPGQCVASVNMPKGDVEVRQAAVRLSDVFSGIAQSDDEDIAQAPFPCRQETYDVNVLTRLSNKYHLDWKPRTLADHVIVTSACTRIPASAIADQIKQSLKDKGIGSQIRDSVDVTFDNHALEVDLPVDQTPGFVINNFTYDAVSKYFRADVVAESSSGPFAVPVTGRITVKHSVPVLAHRLEGGSIVTSNDLDWVDVPDDHINSSVITEADQLVGFQLRRDTEGGQIFHDHDVMSPRLVSRGKLVTLRIETSFMTLSAQGKALQDGGPGDVVRVLNLESERVVEGVAESEGVVRVAIADHAVMGDAKD